MAVSLGLLVLTLIAAGALQTTWKLEGSPAGKAEVYNSEADEGQCWRIFLAKLA